MKLHTTAAALALVLTTAFTAPAAEARTAPAGKGHHATTSMQAKMAAKNTAKKPVKAKKKHAKKGYKKAA